MQERFIQRTYTRRKQNLQDIDIEDDSEDKYIPGEEDEDEALLIEETDDFQPKRRKRNKSFSRKDSFNRH